MLGLSDAHIARRPVQRVVLKWQREPGHAKGDGAYVLSREPDFIIMGAGTGCPAEEPTFLSDLEIAEDPRFVAKYRKEAVELNATEVLGDKSRGVLMWFYYYRKIRP